MAMKENKYLITRRIAQAGILFLFLGGNLFHWKILRGNLSSARIFDSVPLTDPFAVLQNMFAGSVLTKEAVTGAIIIFLSYAVIGGRVFCGWVCPVNMVTDAANKLRDMSRFDSLFNSWQIDRKTRYLIAGMALVLSAIFGVAAFEWISPIGVLHRGVIYGMGLGWAFVLAVFLFDLFAVKNGFCGHLCPLGGFYALAGRLGFLRIGYDKNKCTSCMKCLNVCPEKQVLHIVGKTSGAVLSGECINCGRCIEVCQDHAMQFNNIYSHKTINNK
jgi:ferredoxin-type protein NapH